MTLFSRLSLKSKLVYLLLGVSLGCILVVGYQGLSNGKREITKKVYDQLTSMRATHANELEHYFRKLKQELASLSENRMTVNAMREFSSAFARFEDVTLSDGQLESLSRFYTDHFLQQLSKNMDGTPDPAFYTPSTPAAQYLQYQYISNNTPTSGTRADLMKASDKSYYSGVHDYYHNAFKELASNLEYYDLFLIDFETGDIVYSVQKEPDFATNLKTGPYANSNLAKLYRRVVASQDKGAVVIQDFEFYRPSYNQPAAFVGTVIYDNNRPSGVLVTQIPINQNLNYEDTSRDWQAEGMGKTGEMIIVGPDKLLRTNVRSLIENPGDQSCYRNQLPGESANNPVSERICRNRNAVLLQEADSYGVNQALQGHSGTSILRGYNGRATLTSYGPLNIDGLNWVMLAQMEVDEANAPVYGFQRSLTLSTVLLGCLVTLLAMWLSRIFTAPVNQLMEGVKRLGDGDLDVEIDLKRNDEFGQLAQTFNKTVHLIRKQRKEIDEKNAENEALLLNVLPTAVAKRVREGEHQVADRIPNVSVLFSSIRGFTSYAESLDPQTAVRELNELVNAFDDAADSFGVEKVKTIGDSYMACCGLTIARLDHARRIVEYAREMIAIVERFNAAKGTNLGIRIGIHCGPVIAGIVGRSRFVYDLWGDSVNIASRIRYEARPNSILITSSVYERLSNQDGFVRIADVETKGMGVLQIWSWSVDDSNGLMPQEDDDTQVIPRPEFARGVEL